MWYPENDNSESCNGTARYQLPYINRTTAEDVFNLLRDHKQGRGMQNVTLLTGDWISGGDKSSIMSWKRARVACTVEDSKAVCKAEGFLYYKGFWARDDLKLDYYRWRQPGIELTDEQLWDAYKRRIEAEKKQFYGELDDQ
jgi:hypothetical protein